MECPSCAPPNIFALQGLQPSTGDTHRTSLLFRCHEGAAWDPKELHVMGGCALLQSVLYGSYNLESDLSMTDKDPPEYSVAVWTLQT